MNRNAVKQRFTIIGDSPKLNQAVDIARQVAPTEVTVLVVGENGTGKDVFSKIIHQLGKRKHRPFMAVNCGAIPEGTMDSELFGHEKGSFTSAYEARKGYFEEVNGGVIFLDEIAEMPVQTQARLLRLLENGEFLRVGSSKVQKTDVRIVAATNKNLLDAIRRGAFREDLFYRLNTVTIHVPPLRERGSDVELLFRYFANEFADRYGRRAVQLAEAAKDYLYDYHWPGNVRELRNFVEKLTVLTPEEAPVGASEMQEFLPVTENQLPVLLGPGSFQQAQSGGFQSAENEFLFKALLDMRQEMTDIKRAIASLLTRDYEPENEPLRQSFTENENLSGVRPYFPPQQKIIRQPRELDSKRFEDEDVLPTPPPARETPLLEESLSIERKEKELIARALSKFKNNRKRAAQELGVSERTLYRKIKAYGLE